MSDKFYIGQQAVNLETSQWLKPFTGVRLWYDDEAFYFSGDDTGRVLEANCPWATQAMADEILASVEGFCTFVKNTS